MHVIVTMVGSRRAATVTTEQYAARRVESQGDDALVAGESLRVPHVLFALMAICQLTL